MRRIDWNAVPDNTEFDNPTPGAYIAVIRRVVDEPAKEYLRIEWDFAEGSYKDANMETYDRAGFWPIVLIRSYKTKALPFFKAWKTAVEASNPGFHFDESNLDALVGRKFGVVLGEEGYQKSNGMVGKRLYVYQTRSVQAITRGEYEVPEYKPFAGPAATATAVPSFSAPAANAYSNFASIGEDYGDLPF